MGLNAKLMFHVLIDTCVWLDLAKDHKQESLLSVIEALIKRKELVLIVPEIVLDEFNRNKAHVAKDGVKSYLSAIRRAQDAVRQLGHPKNRQAIQSYLGDIGHKLPQMGNDALESLSTIEKLLVKAPTIKATDNVLIRAARRGIEKIAPFHRGKNSMNDSILIEAFLEYRAANDAPGHRFAFITHNKNDFSSPTDERLPHPDITHFFTKVKSLYSTNLGETLRKIEPELVTDLMMEAEFEFLPRTQGEILKAENDLINKVWYNRHHNWLYRIKKGEHKIVPRSEYKGGVNTTPVDIFRDARKSAERMEKRYPADELGPWSDFEWGMINGKLSALRWVLGEDWDELYT